MTEIFLQDDCFLRSTDEEANKTVDDRIAEVSEAMMKALRQPVSFTILFGDVYQVYGVCNLTKADIHVQPLSAW